MPGEKRYVVDCGRTPSATGCTLVISGREQEVLDCACQHAVSAHGHPDTPELRENIRQMMQEAEPERKFEPVA